MAKRKTKKKKEESKERAKGMEINIIINLLSLLIAFFAMIITSLIAYQTYSITKNNQYLNLNIETTSIDDNVVSMHSVNTEDHLSLIEFAVKVEKGKNSGEIRDMFVIDSVEAPDDIRMLYPSYIHAEKPFEYTNSTKEQLTLNELLNINLEDEHVMYTFTDGNIVYLQERNSRIHVCVKVVSENAKKYHFVFRGYARDIEVFTLLLNPKKKNCVLLRDEDISDYENIEEIYNNFEYISKEEMIEDLVSDVEMIKDYLN